MKSLTLVLAILLVTACASTPDVAPTPEIERSIERPVPEIWTGTSVPQIDYLGLARSLGLDKPKTDLGYLEKSFDTCEVGYGYSSSNNCRRETFAAINFQILCRDSDGTVSVAVTREDMKPLSGRSLKWTLRGVKGTMRLDGEGFGQVRGTFSRSPRSDRIKLSVDNDFLYVRAEEVKRLVTPKNWCN